MDAILHRLHRIHPGFPLTSIWRGFKRFFTVLNLAREAQHTCTRLYGLKETELARMGLTREEIPQFIARKFL